MHLKTSKNFARKGIIFCLKFSKHFSGKGHRPRSYPYPILNFWICHCVDVTENSDLREFRPFCDASTLNFKDVTSKFLLQLRRRGTLGRRSRRAVSVVQPVRRSMTSAGVDPEVQRHAVERQPGGRSAQVHGHTGRPAWPPCICYSLRRTKQRSNVVATTIPASGAKLSDYNKILRVSGCY